MESKTVWNALDASPEIAWESPLKKGVFHYPAGSVDKKPPKFDSDTQLCAWSGKKWVVSEIPPPPVLEAPPMPEVPDPINEALEIEEEEIEPYIPTYADKRMMEYGTIPEQMEFITENGLEAWQSKVAEIKKKYPKE